MNLLCLFYYSYKKIFNKLDIAGLETSLNVKYHVQPIKKSAFNSLHLIKIQTKLGVWVCFNARDLHKAHIWDLQKCQGVGEFYGDWVGCTVFVVILIKMFGEFACLLQSALLSH